MKGVMRGYGERNNESKEKNLKFGSDEAIELRILVLLVRADADARMRIKIPNGFIGEGKGRIKMNPPGKEVADKGC